MYNLCFLMYVIELLFELPKIIIILSKAFFRTTSKTKFCIILVGEVSLYFTAVCYVIN